MGICQTKVKSQGVTDSKAVIEPEKIQNFEIGNEAPLTNEGVDRQTLEEQKVRRDVYDDDDSDFQSEEGLTGAEVAVENPEDRPPIQLKSSSVCHMKEF